MAAFSDSGDRPHLRRGRKPPAEASVEVPKGDATATSPEANVPGVDQEKFGPDLGASEDLKIFYDDEEKSENREAAFERIQAKCRQPLLLHVESRLAMQEKSAGLAHDIVHESFTKLLLSRDPGQTRWPTQSELHFQRYLKKVALNLLRDEFRRLKRARDRLDKVVASQEARTLNADDAHTTVIQKECSHIILHAMREQLADTEYFVIICRFFCGFTLAYLGEILGKTTSQVDRIQRRALVRMREYLALNYRDQFLGFDFEIDDFFPGNDNDHGGEDDG